MSYSPLHKAVVINNHVNKTNARLDTSIKRIVHLDSKPATTFDQARKDKEKAAKETEKAKKLIQIQAQNSIKIDKILACKKK